ncbi:MAG: class I SAM-dependent methyltransferase [Gemmatimonadota bacterium]|nr:MAG: class I SAM-dependent methyltransferase [Gemmatimonadota bacterium]
MDVDQFELHAEMEDRHWWFLGRRHILQTLVGQLVPAGAGKLVVDVGCGTGGNIGALGEHYATVGIDTSATAIDLARRRFPRTRFWCGELAEAPGDLDADADLFLLTDVIEHVSDDFLLLSTLLARCKVGAHVLITVPANPHLWSSHDVALGHYRRYDVARFRRVWDGLPVDLRLLSYFNARLYPPIRLIRWVTRRLGGSAGRLGTDLSVPPASINRVLARIFAGEGKVLARRLDENGSGGYRAGASLVAVLRLREAGISPRGKPADVPADGLAEAGRGE